MTSNRAERQDSFFEIAPRFVCNTPGASRVVFGAAAEEIACKVLGLDRIRINGSFEVNFDAERNGVFYEIKSTRTASGKIVCYNWRMKKEEQFPGLMYCIVSHNISGANDNVLERMAAGCSLLLCDASKIRELINGLPEHKHKSEKKNGKRSGYTRPGYIDGYKNLPVSALTSRVRMSFAVLANIYGIERRVPVSII
jgi:hypothetical protein